MPPAAVIALSSPESIGDTIHAALTQCQHHAYHTPTQPVYDAGMGKAAGEKRVVETVKAQPMLDFIKRNGASQAAFAVKIDETKQTLTNWKRRGIPMRAVPKVARAMGVTFEEYQALAEGRSPIAQDPDKLTPEAMAVARAWQQLSPGKRARYLEELLWVRFFETKFPAYRTGVANAVSYDKFEKSVEADWERMMRQIKLFP